MKKFLITFAFFCFSLTSVLYAQSMTFEKQKDLSCSLWDRDQKIPRLFWPIKGERVQIGLLCVGNNLTRVIIKEKSVVDVLETINHPDLSEEGYLVINFGKKIKKVKGYYAEKEPFGYTLVVTLVP